MIVPIMALMIPITAIIAFFVTVIVIVGMVRQKSSAADIMPADAKAMIDAMERMENRIATLEKILDAEQPKWRSQL